MIGTTGLPTRLLLQSSRMAVADSQRQLAEAQSESTSGRHADVGLTLGSRTGESITLRMQLASIEAASNGGNLAAVTASMTQDALSALSGVADRFRSQLAGARSAGPDPSVIASLAITALGSLEDQLSITHDGNFLFSGLASGSRPLKNYGDGPKQAVVDSFVATFGFPPDDPAAANLSATDVVEYMDGAFSSLFVSPAWSAVWSDAAADTGQFRPATGTPISLSSTAYAPFARKLAKAFSIAELLGSSRITGAAFTAASERAMILSAEAQSDIASEQSRVGIGQSRLKEAMLTLGQRKDVISRAVASLENVDPYDVATRMNLLMNQLESSYAVTGRLSKMSLLSYL